ncbi:MAG TPA: plastocyanin/azurin family copper-binding protein [Gemmatimonadales bacterium]|nr:plastocyanin/azurin family copper-binding protein [Gemmatimonadales bacterium]
MALILSACGGGEQPAAEPDAAAPAPAAAATGATHDVNMVLEGSSYMYVPSQLTIKSGDVVVFHNISGGPHNVNFWADSIPAGTQALLNAAMPDRMGDLTGPLLVAPNETYTIHFAGAPAGQYGFYCLPHLAMGQTGKLTIVE